MKKSLPLCKMTHDLGLYRTNKNAKSSTMDLFPFNQSCTMNGHPHIMTSLLT